jgi:hypothetical protein
MELRIQRVLDMARRVRDFCASHPDPTNAGYTAAVTLLDERLARAEVLAQQHVTGRQTVTGASATTHELRGDILDSINLLAGLAQAASQEDPELTAGITRLPMHGSRQELLTKARVAAATAAAKQDILVRYGLPDGLLESLTTALDTFEEVINDRNAGRAAHVGARADLSSVEEGIMALVRRLDAISRYRFRHDAELLAAWKSARNVAWPLRAEKEPPASGETQQPAA